MRLSTILELLLIFLLIAFAAYGRVIVPEGQGRGIEKKSSHGITTRLVNTSKQTTTGALKQAAENVNKYCVCNDNICNCCRDFHIPLVRLSGPGCASLQYLQDDKLAMQLSIGENILSSNIVNGKNPKPVCVALPGGFSKFCGKIYSIKRDADKHFKACLGLELRAASELEASLRVSCFRFGPDGLKLRPAEPLPALVTEASTTSDDDYDGLFGLDEDDEDDEEEDEDDDDEQKISPEDNALASAGSSSGIEPQDNEAEDEEDEEDPLGFSALLDIFAGGDDEPPKKKPSTSTALPPSFAIPILALTTQRPVAAAAAGNDVSSASVSPVSKRPLPTTAAVTAAAAATVTVPTSTIISVAKNESEDFVASARPTSTDELFVVNNTDNQFDLKNDNNNTVEDEQQQTVEPSEKDANPDTTEYPQDGITTANQEDEQMLADEEGASTPGLEANAAEVESQTTAAATVAATESSGNKVVKPDRKVVLAIIQGKPAFILKKTGVPSRKISVTSQSINAIKNEVKPQQQQQQQPQQQPSVSEDNDDDEDDDEEEDYDSEAEGENEEADDSEEEENAVDEEDENKETEQGDKKKVTEAEKNEETDDNDEDEDDDDDDEEEDDDDESEEEEDAVLSALVDDEDDDKDGKKKNKKKKTDKTPNNKNAQNNNDDYSDELVELLARNQKQERTVNEERIVPRNRGRQSKDMRF